MLPIKTIIHPTDFSPRSEYALRMAGSLARDYGARLILLHVIPPPVLVPMEGIVPLAPEDFKAKVEAKLNDLQVADCKVKVERRVATGDPIREILSAAHDTGADVIVLGTHGWSGLARLLMGSVAEGVSRKAACPVLTVKMPAAAEKAVEREAELAPLELPV